MEIDFLIDRCLNIISWLILSLAFMFENFGSRKKECKSQTEQTTKLGKTPFLSQNSFDEAANHWSESIIKLSFSPHTDNRTARGLISRQWAMYLLFVAVCLPLIATLPPPPANHISTHYQSYRSSAIIVPHRGHTNTTTNINSTKVLHNMYQKHLHKK